MDGMELLCVDEVLPRSWVKREIPLLKRAQMDELVDGSGDVSSESEVMELSAQAQDVSLMSKSQLRAGLTHRLSLKSSHDT